MKPQVSIIMGSDSDLPVMQKAADILNELKVSHEIEVVSAHRTPKKMVHFADRAKSRGIKVIIAGAGGAAHLPGMVAALTTLPVIGVPVKVGALDGMDSLLSIVQMPRGVPVATMAIDNALNAGLLAARIIALSDAKISSRLATFKKRQEKKVERANQHLDSLKHSPQHNHRQGASGL